MEAFDPSEAAGVSAYTAVVKRDGDWWIGWVEEVPGVNAQERTRERLVVALKAVLQEALEMNRAEARAAAGSSYEELALAL
jgi:predicted RNase H-like HicB family nuclease